MCARVYRLFLVLVHAEKRAAMALRAFLELAGDLQRLLNRVEHTDCSLHSNAFWRAQPCRRERRRRHNAFGRAVVSVLCGAVLTSEPNWGEPLRVLLCSVSVMVVVGCWVEMGL